MTLGFLAVFAALAWGVGRFGALWGGVTSARSRLLRLSTMAAAAGMLAGLGLVLALLAFEPERALPLLVGSVQAGELGVLFFAAEAGIPIPAGWPRPRALAEALGLAVATVIVSGGWTMAWGALSGVAVQEQAVVTGLREVGGMQLWLVSAQVALVAPLLEELVFRGVGYGEVEAVAGPRVALVVSSVVFAALHLDAPVAVVPILFLGVGLGLLRRRWGSVVPGIVAHAANNLLALALSFGS